MGDYLLNELTFNDVNQNTQIKSTKTMIQFGEIIDFKTNEIKFLELKYLNWGSWYIIKWD